MPRFLRTLALAALLLPGMIRAEEPLSGRIDALILAKANGKPPAAIADDGEFLRRVYLDLAGRVPSVAETRAFLADKAADKRAKLIDKLLASDDYPRRMQDAFHVILMERQGDHPDWAKYLRDSFAANKPWDQLAREVLRADPNNVAVRGASFFYARRLEHYGENPVDYPGLVRDVGRLFLGMDLRCAQCHDHLFIRDYKQADFQGLFAFYKNVSLHDAKAATVAEKPTTEKVSFMSVFRKVETRTGPRLPGGKEIEIPAMKKGEEYATPPDVKTKLPGTLKFSPLAKIAEELPRAENRPFVRNIVNRLWCLLMGRGLVHPLDLHHSANPPSHPEVLDLLEKEFVAHKFDIQWLLRELALTQTYQRSSILPDGKDVPRESFLVALEKYLTAEQLLAGMLEATRQPRNVAIPEAVKAKFVKAFTGPVREPEDEVSVSLKAALFVLNDDTVLGWLQPKDGNLVDRLAKLTDADAIAEELYLTVLTRMPTAEEKAEVSAYLAKNASRKPAALGHLAWALLASTEFGVNH